jgi:hypothetical protein
LVARKAQPPLIVIELGSGQAAPAASRARDESVVSIARQKSWSGRGRAEGRAVLARQWVLWLPIPLRLLLAAQPNLVTSVL